MALRRAGTGRRRARPGRRAAGRRGARRGARRPGSAQPVLGRGVPPAGPVPGRAALAAGPARPEPARPGRRRGPDHRPRCGGRRAGRRGDHSRPGPGPPRRARRRGCPVRGRDRGRHALGASWPTSPRPRRRSGVCSRARSRSSTARCRSSPCTPPRVWSGTSWRVAGFCEDAFPAKPKGSDHWLKGMGVLPFPLRGDRDGLPSLHLHGRRRRPGRADRDRGVRRRLARPPGAGGASAGLCRRHPPASPACCAAASSGATGSPSRADRRPSWRRSLTACLAGAGTIELLGRRSGRGRDQPDAGRGGRRAVAARPARPAARRRSTRAPSWSGAAMHGNAAARGDAVRWRPGRAVGDRGRPAAGRAGPRAGGRHG